MASDDDGLWEDWELEPDPAEEIALPDPEPEAATVPESVHEPGPAAEEGPATDPGPAPVVQAASEPAPIAPAEPERPDERQTVVPAPPPSRPSTRTVRRPSATVGAARDPEPPGRRCEPGRPRAVLPVLRPPSEPAPADEPALPALPREDRGQTCRGSGRLPHRGGRRGLRPRAAADGRLDPLGEGAGSVAQGRCIGRGPGGEDRSPRIGAALGGMWSTRRSCSTRARSIDPFGPPSASDAGRTHPGSSGTTRRCCIASPGRPCRRRTTSWRSIARAPTPCFEDWTRSRASRSSARRAAVPLCDADDGQVFTIASELRTPRLPHAGCPRGLCRCDWFLASGDQAEVRRHLRRRARTTTAGQGPS